MVSLYYSSVFDGHEQWLELCKTYTESKSKCFEKVNNSFRQESQRTHLLDVLRVCVYL